MTTEEVCLLCIDQTTLGASAFTAAPLLFALLPVLAIKSHWLHVSRALRGPEKGLKGLHFTGSSSIAD